MKPGPVTKLDERNKTIFKNSDDDIMPANCDVIVIFTIYVQFAAIWKRGSGSIICETYIFINSYFCLTKTENRTKKTLT